MDFADILNYFREEARNNRELGDKFERLVASYLLADPQFSSKHRGRAPHVLC